MGLLRHAELDSASPSDSSQEIPDQVRNDESTNSCHTNPPLTYSSNGSLPSPIVSWCFIGTSTVFR